MNVINKLEKNLRVTQSILKKKIEENETQFKQEQKESKKDNKEFFDYINSMYKDKIKSCNIRINDLASLLTTEQIKQIDNKSDDLPKRKKTKKKSKKKVKGDNDKKQERTKKKKKRTKSKNKK